MLATDTSYLGDLTKTLGAKNIANNLDTNVKSPYIQFSLEQILEQNPDYILRFAHGELEQTKRHLIKLLIKTQHIRIRCS
ncbi:ABC transporter substrate-binding protein [Paraclostridium bifermentans]|nr:ABC transporter substrate-binding protein [Paraclostridium bifermentans]